MDNCTLTDAVARIAYGREYDGRYNGPLGMAWSETDARALRRRNRFYPSNSGLPGASVLNGQPNQAAFAEALAAWKEVDSRKWHDAERVLLAELVAGNIKAFDELGNAVSPEFWLANNLRSRRACHLLLRASNVERLLQRMGRRAQDEFEANRENMIARFAEKQRRLRNWISFADMADWCAREGGSIQPDARLRADAYRQLGEAIARGEFQVNGLTRTLFLNPAVQWFKMTRERFEACPYDIRDDLQGVSDLKITYLECCWIPRAMSAQWFAARRIQPPPWVMDHERDASRKPLPMLRPTQTDQSAIEQSAAATAAPPASTSNPPPSPGGGRPPKGNRGGRPVAWDWDAFTREVVRLANTPDGLPARADLQRLMLDWCEQAWGKSPADSTVRDRIARLYPE